jgi:hypothetical protein
LIRISLISFSAIFSLIDTEVSAVVPSGKANRISNFLNKRGVRQFANRGHIWLLRPNSPTKKTGIAVYFGPCRDFVEHGFGSGFVGVRAPFTFSLKSKGDGS